MAVRIKLRLEPALPGVQGHLESAVIVNSGFESDEPEIILPSRAAERLGLWPTLPAGATRVDYETLGGGVPVIRIPGALRASLEVPGQRLGPFGATAVISEVERELILNDWLAGEMGIVILDLRRGEWALRGGDLGRPRPSEAPEYW